MPQLFTHVDPNEAKSTDGSDILYLILTQSTSKDNEDRVERDWQFVTGRQVAYDLIKDLLLNENDNEVEFVLDIDKSFIYADNPAIPADKNKLKLSNGLTLYEFMKDCYILQKVKEDDGFNIDDFHSTDIDE